MDPFERMEFQPSRVTMRNTMIINEFRPHSQHIQEPPDPWARRDKHRKDYQRDKHGYHDSYLSLIINSLKGFAERDNCYFGKIDDEERNKIVKMEYPTRIIFVIIQRAIYDGCQVKPGLDSMDSDITDVIIEKTNENGEVRRRYINVQLSGIENVEITSLEPMFTDQLTPLSFAKYFIDYREKKRVLNFNEYVLCTNAYFDIADDNFWEGIMVHQPQVDWTLDINDESKNFRINKRMIAKLKPKLRACFQRVIAQRIVKCLFEGKELKNDVHSIYIKDYIVDVETKKFREDFVQGKNKDRPLPIDINQFRDFIIIEIKERDNNLDLNKIIKSDRQFKLEDNFGTTKFQHLGVRGHIDDKELDQFFDEFLVAAYAPDDHRSIKYVSWRMSTQDLEINENGKVTPQNSMKRLWDWLRSVGKEDITSSQEIKDILKEKRIRVTNWFPSVEPVHYLVGRDALLRKIRERIEHNEMIVITGTGGIGKSQLVNMYIKQFGCFYDENIIWMYSNEHDKLVVQYRNLTRNGMCIYSLDQEKLQNFEETMKQVIDYFNGKKWLLVFDNAEPDIFEKTYKGKFLPEIFIEGSQPDIIITSRKRSWTRGHIIRLQPFIERECREVILRNVDLRLNRRQARTSDVIGKMFDYFPLAIYQTITYINRRCRLLRNVDHDLNFTMDEMVAEYNIDPLKMLDYREANMNRELYSRTIMKTWDPTLEDIETKEKNGDKAIKLLYLAAFIENDNIPKDTFLEIVDDKEDDLNGIVNVIHEYSMLELVDTDKLYMYQIMKKVLRLKLKEDGRKDKQVFEEAKKLISNEKNQTKELKLFELDPDPEPPVEQPQEMAQSTSQTVGETSGNVTK